MCDPADMPDDPPITDLQRRQLAELIGTPPLIFGDVLIPYYPRRRYSENEISERARRFAADARRYTEIGGIMHASFGEPSTSDRAEHAQRAGESFDAWQRRIDPRTRAKHHKTAAAEQKHRDDVRARNRPKNKAAKKARKANR